MCLATTSWARMEFREQEIKCQEKHSQAGRRASFGTFTCWACSWCCSNQSVPGICLMLGGRKIDRKEIVCTHCPWGPNITEYSTVYLKNTETKNKLERQTAGLEPGIHWIVVRQQARHVPPYCIVLIIHMGQWCYPLHRVLLGTYIPSRAHSTWWP